MAFLDRASTTNYSSRALDAAAAVVDTAPGSFQAFHDLLYANQPEEGSAGLTDAQLLDYAVQAGAAARRRRRGPGEQPVRRLGAPAHRAVLAEVHLDADDPGRRHGSCPPGSPTAQQMRDVVTKAAAAKGLPTPS